MSNKVYVLQVSDGEDPKLLSKIITTTWSQLNSQAGPASQPSRWVVENLKELG